jgi:hypothetical protein
VNLLELDDRRTQVDVEIPAVEVQVANVTRVWSHFAGWYRLFWLQNFHQ